MYPPHQFDVKVKKKAKGDRDGTFPGSKLKNIVTGPRYMTNTAHSQENDLMSTILVSVHRASRLIDTE